MLETFGGNLKVSYWRDSVSLYLGLLTRQALSSPLTHILANIGPDKLVSYRLTSAFDTRMAQSMNDVEDASAVRQRHKRSRRTVGDIYIEEGGTNLKLAEAEASLGVPA